MTKIRWPLLWAGMFGIGLSACSAEREEIRSTGKAPDESIAGYLNGAIFDDLKFESELNWGGWTYVLRGSDSHKDLFVNIRDIRCRSTWRRKLCDFDLVRAVSLEGIADKDAPKALRCTARFLKVDGGWQVERLRPKGAGHTQTTMQCSEVQHLAEHG